MVMVSSLLIFNNYNNKENFAQELTQKLEVGIWCLGHLKKVQIWKIYHILNMTFRIKNKTCRFKIVGSTSFCLFK